MIKRVTIYRDQKKYFKNFDVFIKNNKIVTVKKILKNILICEKFEISKQKNRDKLNFIITTYKNIKFTYEKFD